MYLREKLDERLRLKNQISILSDMVEKDLPDRDVILSLLLSAMEDLQNMNLIIAKINHQTEIAIGKASIPVSMAVEIRKTLAAKLNLIFGMMRSNNGSLDVKDLVGKIKPIQEEFNSIDTAIRLSDWSIIID